MWQLQSLKHASNSQQSLLTSNRVRQALLLLPMNIRELNYSLTWRVQNPLFNLTLAPPANVRWLMWGEFWRIPKLTTKDWVWFRAHSGLAWRGQEVGVVLNRKEIGYMLFALLFTSTPAQYLKVQIKFHQTWSSESHLTPSLAWVFCSYLPWPPCKLTLPFAAVTDATESKRNNVSVIPDI